MRYAKMLVMALLCLTITAAAQSSVLKTIVSGKYIKTPVSFLLKDIERRYNVNFYYSNNLKTLKKEISIEFQNKPLSFVLEKVFKDSEISYEVVGQQIILKKTTPVPIKPKTSANKGIAPSFTDSVGYLPGKSLEALDTISDTYILPEDSSKSKLVRGNTKDSVINSQSLKYQRISAITREDLERQYLEARKNLREQYYKLSDSLNHKPSNKGTVLKENINEVLLDLQREIDRISDTLSKQKVVADLNEIKNKFTDTTRNAEGLIYRPAQMALLPGITTNGVQFPNAVNNFSLNVLGGYAAGVEGVEIGSVFNIDQDYVRGTQAAGVFNIVKNDVTGVQSAGVFNTAGEASNAVQLAGVFNIVSDSLKGFQAGGVLNIANGNLRGGQASGFANIVQGKLTGPQFAGFLNYSKDTAVTAQFSGFTNINLQKTTGFQAAGFLNLCKSEFKGTQVSGFINSAGKVKGTQIGIINIADSVSGAQIGLLSIAKNGYRKLDIFSSETTKGNITFRMGTRRFYNIFTAGGTYNSNNDWFWTLGYGFGSEMGIGKRGFVNFDLVCNQIHENQFWTYQYLNLLNQFKVTPGFSFGKHFSIYGGPVLNVMVSQKQNQDGIVTGPAIAPSWKSFDVSKKDTNVQIWVGFNLGIRI